jgi:hypothetical protein
LKNGVNVLFLLVIAGFAGILLHRQNPEVASPRIEFVQQRLDLGNLPDYKKVPFVFRFRNRGQTELVIREVRTTCGCTAALVERDRYRPGEWGTIRGTVDTVGKSGSIEERVYVKTNEVRLAPVHELVLTGSVRPSHD